LDCQVFRGTKVNEEIVENQAKKDFRESQVFQEFKVLRVIKVKKVKSVHREIKEIKDSGVIKEIKEKLDHLVIKERGEIKVKKECPVVLEAQVNQEKRD
jgi:hypothetical protein